MAPDKIFRLAFIFRLAAIYDCCSPHARDSRRRLRSPQGNLLINKHLITILKGMCSSMKEEDALQSMIRTVR